MGDGNGGAERLPWRRINFYRKAEHFSVKEIHLHGPNVIIFQMVTGRRTWHVVGCYITPSNASTTEDVAADIRDRPYGEKLLVTGNLNTNQIDPEGTPQGEAIVDELVSTGIEDMGLKFLQRCKTLLQDRCAWSMRRDGLEVRSRTNHILGTDLRLFQDVAVQDPRHNLDHYMVLGCLMGEPAKDLTEYLRKARRLPLRPIRRDLASASEKLFSDLNNNIPNNTLLERVRRAWISDETWADMDARVTSHREGDHRTIRKIS